MISRHKLILNEWQYENVHNSKLFSHQKLKDLRHNLEMVKLMRQFTICSVKLSHIGSGSAWMGDRLESPGPAGLDSVAPKRRVECQNCPWWL